MFKGKVTVKPKPAGIPDVAKPPTSVGGVLPPIIAPMFAHKAPPPPLPAVLNSKTMPNPVAEDVRRNIETGFRAVHELQGSKRVAVAVGLAMSIAGGLVFLGEYMKRLAPSNLSDAIKEGQLQPQFPVPAAYAPKPDAAGGSASAGAAMSSSEPKATTTSSTAPAAASASPASASTIPVKLRPANRPGWVNSQETPPAAKLKVYLDSLKSKDESVIVRRVP